MAEAGGPTTQAGILYQNSIATLYMGRMLDLSPRGPQQRVVEVRLEAPSSVDDVIVSFADGAKYYIQAKLRLSLHSEAWSKLWKSFVSQYKDTRFSRNDKLVLNLGEPTQLGSDLRGCIERALTSENVTEWRGRLTARQTELVKSINNLTYPEDLDFSALMKLLCSVEIHIVPESEIERDYVSIWMPEGSTSKDSLFKMIRSIAGEAARMRASFDATKLRTTLKEQYNIQIHEPGNWGAQKYRRIISGRAVIEVPGTSMVKSISEAYIWPKANHYDRNKHHDFDDEMPHLTFHYLSPSQINFKIFPSPGFDRIIVVAGPGFGKTLLTFALAAENAGRGLLPALISIPEFSQADLSIIDYLSEEINKDTAVNVDWKAVAENGLLTLLLDGLDEISADKRIIALEQLKRFSLAYPNTPWLLTVRDAAALPAPLGATVVELAPLDNQDISKFIEVYSPHIRSGLYNRILNSPDIFRLARIPLFLAMLLSTLESADHLPTTRSDLIEDYLHVLLRPEKFKISDPSPLDYSNLRKILEEVSFIALEREEVGVNIRAIERAIRNHTGNEVLFQEVIDQLVKFGLLRKGGPNRLAFPFPIIQEYLAACHIILERQNEIPERLRLIAKRPWAQTLQFVLEQIPDPAPLIAALMDRPDDIFHTNLRLIARCVTNGMAISEVQRKDLNRRLGKAWPCSTWDMRRKIGDYINSTLSIPLVPEVGENLVKSWAMSAGGDDLLIKIADRSLALSLVKNYLRGELDHSFDLGKAYSLVDADMTLKLFLDRSKDPSLTPDQVENLAHSIRFTLGRNHPSETLLRDTINDTNLHVFIRIAALELCTDIPPDSISLLEESMLADEYIVRYLATSLLAKIPEGVSKIFEVLNCSSVPMDRRLELLDFYSQSFFKEDARSPEEGLFKVITAAKLPGEFTPRLKAVAACYRESFFKELVSGLDTASIDIVLATLSIFGHYQSRHLVETAIQSLKKRTFTLREFFSIGHAFERGMMTIWDMQGMRSGPFRATPPHVGIDLCLKYFEETAPQYPFDRLDVLRFNIVCALLGSKEALNSLPKEFENYLRDSNFEIANNEDCILAGNVIYTLLGLKRLLSIDLIEQIVRQCPHNVSYHAVGMLGAHGSREALDCLIMLFSEAKETSIRPHILEVLEPLAGRFGQSIRRIDIDTLGVMPT
jgi:hypothetical protein